VPDDRKGARTSIVEFPSTAATLRGVKNQLLFAKTCEGYKEKNQKSRFFPKRRYRYRKMHVDVLYLLLCGRTGEKKQISRACNDRRKFRPTGKKGYVLKLKHVVLRLKKKWLFWFFPPVPFMCNRENRTARHRRYSKGKSWTSTSKAADDRVFDLCRIIHFVFFPRE